MTAATLLRHQHHSLVSTFTYAAPNVLTEEAPYDVALRRKGATLRRTNACILASHSPLLKEAMIGCPSSMDFNIIFEASFSREIVARIHDFIHHGMIELSSEENIELIKNDFDAIGIYLPDDFWYTWQNDEEAAERSEDEDVEGTYLEPQITINVEGLKTGDNDIFNESIKEEETFGQEENLEPPPMKKARKFSVSFDQRRSQHFRNPPPFPLLNQNLVPDMDFVGRLAASTSNIFAPRPPVGSRFANGNNGGTGAIRSPANIQLWEFLLDQLTDPDCAGAITWTGNGHEFKISDSDEIARRWGYIKNNPKMTYEKLSRSLRHYYEKNLMSKTNERFVYRFNNLAIFLQNHPDKQLKYGNKLPDDDFMQLPPISANHCSPPVPTAPSPSPLPGTSLLRSASTPTPPPLAQQTTTTTAAAAAKTTVPRAKTPPKVPKLVLTQKLQMLKNLSVIRTVAAAAAAVKAEQESGEAEAPQNQLPPPPPLVKQPGFQDQV